MLIIPIPSVIAKPFVDEYCKDYGIPTDHSPDWGHEVHWVGAILRGEIHAIIGYIALAEGIYVHAYHHSKTFAGKRAFRVLNAFTYSMKMPLWGYIRNDNSSMLHRMLKENWVIVDSTETETLVNWSCYN